MKELCCNFMRPDTLKSNLVFRQCIARDRIDDQYLGSVQIRRF